MAITLEQAQARLDAWLDANAAVAEGKTYKMNGRELTLADAKETLEQISYWERRVNALSNNRVGHDVARASFK